MIKKVRIKRHLKNKLLFRMLFVVVISVLVGIFYTAILSNTDKNIIEKSLNAFFKGLASMNYTRAFINCLLSNSFYILLVWLLGISIIGIPFIIFILFIKSFILGFTVSSILYFYKFKGILISIIYIIPLLINLFVMIYLSYYAINFSRSLNGVLFFKKNISFQNTMKRYLKLLLISFIFILVSSVIEIYIIPSVLKFLQI